MFRKLLTLLALCFLPAIAFGQVSDDGKPVKDIFDADVSAGINYWSSDTVYVLQELVYVESGVTLIIEPGTVIKGEQGTGANSKALIVARGGKIYAAGTPTKPIVFTSILDDVDEPDDIPLDTLNGAGLWGGIIILGNAEINTTTGVGQIEGIDPLEPRAAYGGADDDDNSGVFKYVSIRHGGTEIGAANEINGLTMGAVGRGTVISHVEVMFNRDDGFEWFGGTVNTDHLVSVFNADDMFDYDEGWRGANQFWFGLQLANAGDKGGEHDGGTTPEDGEPFALPLISNATLLGHGVAGVPASNRGFDIRDNAGGSYMNSIISDFPTYGLSVEDNPAEPTDSRDRIIAGQLYFRNNIWWGFGFGNTAAAITNNVAAVEAAVFTSGNDFIGDPGFAALDRTTSGILDPRPTTVAGTGWAGWIDPLDPVDGFNPPAVGGYPGAIDVNWPTFEAVTYPGAFDPNSGTPLWVCLWTALDHYGYLADECSVADCACISDDGKFEKDVFDADVSAGINYWSSDTVYVLQELVYVESGSTLIIEPGTVIKGEQGTGANSKALIVARGGNIYANGAMDCPILFTSFLDDVDDPDDIPLDTLNGSGHWGGVIILGNAEINTTTGVGQIEGIDPLEPRAAYGGADDDDNSGVFKYVSIRHGGTEIGAANEINGLTMGAVGRGTVISHVEVMFNRDDGFEWFGGTVNTDHLVSVFNADDCFDYDEGWRGANQFWFGLQLTNAGDKGGEHDGGTTPEDGEPFATPLISNATIIGRGATSPGSSNRGFDIRDNAGGSYMNSIISDFVTYGLSAEDNNAEPTDSRDRIIQGQIYFRNNIWFGFGNGNTAAAISNNVADVQNAVFTSGNDFIGDPGFNNISRAATGDLDPLPSTVAGTGWTSWIDPLDGVDGFNPPAVGGYAGAIDVNWPTFTAVDYPGAFDPTVSIDLSWANGWTALDCYGYLGSANPPGCCLGIRGNFDGDPGDNIDIADLLYMVDYQFGNPAGPAPSCFEEGDYDASSGIDIGDLLAMVDYQFGNPAGPAPLPCP